MPFSRRKHHRPEPHLTADHLTEVRQTANWRQLFEYLQVQKDHKKSREDDWWGKSPFKPDEQTASFHINDHGWFCHSSGRGGGVIELVQSLHPEMTCYDAGRWLVQHGIARVSTEARADLGEVVGQVQKPEAASATSATAVTENLPIRQDLRSQLIHEHPAFRERGIPPSVLAELGAGYLARPPRKNGRPDPMNHRLVFQIRGLQEQSDGYLEPVVLGHIGRATTQEQLAENGKWWTYAGFRKSREIYNLDLMLHDDRALAQATGIGHVLVVEGCFDVAKLYAAGIRNVVATLGARLSESQRAKLDLLSEVTGCDRFLVWYDRDQDGSGIAPNKMGAVEAVELVTTRGLEASQFDWNQTFSSPARSAIAIPEEIGDPCDFSIAQLQWLRQEGVI